jgi:hypothetical protein
MAVGASETRSPLEDFPTTWRRVVTDPNGFFADMPEVGGLGPPTTFLAICAGINALGHLLLGWGLRGALWIFVGEIVGAFLAAALFVVVAQQLFSGRAGFETTFRVVAYAAAPSVFFWLPLVAVIAWLYMAFLIIRGLERIHAFDATRAVLTVLIGFGALWLLTALRTRGPGWF